MSEQKPQPPVVFWRSPNEVPPVKKFEKELFWIAVRHQRSADKDPKHAVFLAHYINKPLEFDEYDEPIDPDPHVNEDGDYVKAVGWHNEYDHHDFSGYYQPIEFNDQYQLLGWAEYVPPVFE